MCGVDPKTRGRRTDECLEVIQGLLSGEPMDHNGEFFEFDKGWIKPAPDQPIPILIGGRADAALERAARFGDGWLGVWTSPERYGAVIDHIDTRANALGRPEPTHHGIQVWVGVDDNRAHARARLAKGMENFYRIPYERFEKYSPFGDAAEVADFLAAYADKGCRLFNIMPVAQSEEAGIDAVADIRERLGG
jgi:alkanesulfonate monooxygenase SsuD/methylene tetrahydromethanopterin reductase-like flavin-dependent oxidoreductase (luciferase family)